MERVREIQDGMAQFEAPRKQMQISPIAAMEHMEREFDELYVGLYDNPTQEQTREIASEIADVFLFLVIIANRYDIDIASATTEKLAYNHERFPVELFDGTNGKTFKENYEEAKRREGKPVQKPITIYTPSLEEWTLMQEPDV